MSFYGELLPQTIYIPSETTQGFYDSVCYVYFSNSPSCMSKRVTFVLREVERRRCVLLSLNPGLLKKV